MGVNMIFHQISTERGCQSYLIGCKDTCAAVVIDPEISQIDRYLAIRETEDETFLDAYRRLGAEPFKDALYSEQKEAA